MSSASEVVEYFVAEYAAGRTPNPCAKCNARRAFRSHAGSGRPTGLSRIATGHYARLIGRLPGLARGVDRAQGPVLRAGGGASETSERTLFPLGEMAKPEVETAARAGLEGHSRPGEPGDLLRARRRSSSFPARAPGRASRGHRGHEGRVLGRHEAPTTSPSDSVRVWGWPAETPATWWRLKRRSGGWSSASAER